MSAPLRARRNIYGPALARLHAQAYGDTFAPAWPWLASQIRAAAPRPYLFDIGCGDGRWLAYARNMKIDGQGIDTSPVFVTMTRENGGEAALESAATMRPPARITAATALGEVLAYKPAALAPAVLTLARALPSGGLLFFDLPGPDIQEGDSDRGGDGWRLSVQLRKQGNLLVRKIQIETSEGLEQEVHEQVLFAPQEALGIVEGFGLQGEILASYGRCKLLPGRFAIRAVKP